MNRRSPDSFQGLTVLNHMIPSRDGIRQHGRNQRSPPKFTRAWQQMSEESLEVCQEATLCVPPPSATREKEEEEEEGGENSICISFHRNVGQGFGVSANWEGGGGGG